MTSIREEHQALGDFEIDLRPDTPALIRNDLLHIDHCGFGHIIVTAVQTADPNPSFDQLAVHARYAGVIRRREGPGNTIIRGSGLAMWMATEDGLDNWPSGYPPAGPGVTNGSTASYFGDTSFLHVIGDLHPPALHRAAGPEITADPFFYEAVGASRMEAINQACQHWGAEWRILADFNAYYGTEAQLYGSFTTPKVLLVGMGDGFEGGRDPNIIGVLADVQPSADVETYSDFVVMTGGETGFGPAIGTAGGFDAFIKDPLGNPARFRRIISDGQTTAGIDAHAELQRERYQSTNRPLTIAVDGAYDLRQDIGTGSTVYVFAPDAGVFDLTQQIYYRGDLITPQRRRVMSMTWEPRPNEGIYYVPGDGSFIVTDLTPWVEFGTGAMSLTIGSTTRGLPFQRARSVVGTGPV